MRLSEQWLRTTNLYGGIGLIVKTQEKISKLSLLSVTACLLH